MQVKKIEVKGGNTLEVEMSDDFLGRVRTSLNLAEGTQPTDDQIINFIYYSFKNAIDKIEDGSIVATESEVNDG